MVDIIQARDWLKRGFKVSNEHLLEGDHFYLSETTEKDGGPILMFNGPGWGSPEEAMFDSNDLEEDTWFILKEEIEGENEFNIIQNAISEFTAKNFIKPNTVLMTDEMKNKLMKNYPFEKNKDLKLTRFIGMKIKIDNTLKNNECYTYNDKCFVGINLAKEETLSDKIIDDEPHEAVYIEDLKETIKKIKEEIDNSDDLRNVGSFYRVVICDIIDKHFGERLI